jgi:hypothetical protein
MKMTRGRDLDINPFGHEFRFWRVRDDGIHLTRGALTKLEEEWRLVGKLDAVQHDL